MFWFSSWKITKNPSNKNNKSLIQSWMQAEWIQAFISRKELQLIAFFCFLFVIILVRLVQLQIFDHQMYDQQLSQQHYKEALLDPERWNIYALDKGGHPVKLTENITLYDLAVDAKELNWTFESDPRFKLPASLRGQPMKPRFIQLITPIIYKHLCEINGMKQVSQEECVKNVELFTGKPLLPKKPDLFYYGNGAASIEYDTFDFSGYTAQYQQVISWFSKSQALSLIVERLNDKIQTGIRSQNSLGYFSNQEFLNELSGLNLPYLKVNGNYVSIVTSVLTDGNRDNARRTVQKLLEKWKVPLPNGFEGIFSPKEWRYIKIVSGLNPALAQEVRELKIKHEKELSTLSRKAEKTIRTPVLYSLVLEPYVRRYYPYGEFLSNVLGYVDKDWEGHYGIEEYFDSVLKGEKGTLKGRTTTWFGNIGTDEFEISNAVDGNDVYLTIDVGLQKEVERLAKAEVWSLRADWISVMVLNTENGQVKASVNAPTFNPNDYNDAYTLVPLGKEHAQLVDNLSYVDIPIYVNSGWAFKQAKWNERALSGQQKFIAKNVVGSQVFVDKNITVPFEPGSIVKAFTVGIGLDADELRFDDKYQDDGSIKIDKYTIKNATNECRWYHDFLHAFSYSCNVGVVRVVQKLGKAVFYNYLEKLGFGQLTNIELAGEKEGTIPKANLAYMTQFFNNAFGQGVSMTNIQLASAYAALVNGGFYRQPTIIQNIVDKKNPQNDYTQKNNFVKIFKQDTTEKLKSAFHYIISTNPGYAKRSNIVTAKLGAKSGTSQVAFRGKYRGGEWWTNATFAGIVTTDNPKYVVLIWIRRPRSNQWWGNTAGPIFKQIAQYILNYDL